MLVFIFVADLFIVMYYMDGGSLAQRILTKNFPRITENDAKVIMGRLFSALHYLHDRGIVHRNVKPENVLLEHPHDARWPETCRLSDFRMACFLDPEAAPSPEAAAFANQVVGTPDYLAPEAASMMMQPDGTRRPCVGPETDMWAAGVTLYNILSCGELPFAGATTPEVLKNARHSPIDFSNQSLREVSESAKSLVRALLNPDRRKRPTADSAMCHPWFGNGGMFLSDEYRAPLYGYQKFRAVAAAFCFVVRLRGSTPGFSRTNSTRSFWLVPNVAAVNLTPHLVTTSGVNIPPSPGPVSKPPVHHHTTSTQKNKPQEVLRTSQTSSVRSSPSSYSSSSARSQASLRTSREQSAAFPFGTCGPSDLNQSMYEARSLGGSDIWGGSHLSYVPSEIEPVAMVRPDMLSDVAGSRVDMSCTHHDPRTHYAVDDGVSSVDPYSHIYGPRPAVAPLSGNERSFQWQDSSQSSGSLTREKRGRSKMLV